MGTEVKIGKQIQISKKNCQTNEVKDLEIRITFSKVFLVQGIGRGFINSHIGWDCFAYF